MGVSQPESLAPKVSAKLPPKAGIVSKVVKCRTWAGLLGQLGEVSRSAVAVPGIPGKNSQATNPGMSDQALKVAWLLAAMTLPAPAA